MRPLPRKMMVQCSIRRDKSGFNRFWPKYICHLSNGGKFLLVGKKRAANNTSNYLISYNMDCLESKPPFYLGKLRSNFLGTEFNVYDHGFSPKKNSNIEKIRE